MKTTVRWDHLPGESLELRERGVVSECIPALEAAGWYCRQVENKKRVKKGFSDWVIIHRSRVVFLEFKTRTGRQSPEQIEFMQLIREHGGEYRVVRSWEDIRDLIGANSA